MLENYRFKTTTISFPECQPKVSDSVKPSDFVLPDFKRQSFHLLAHSSDTPMARLRPGAKDSIQASHEGVRDMVT